MINKLRIAALTAVTLFGLAATTSAQAAWYYAPQCGYVWDNYYGWVWVCL